ncbi:MAG: CpsD/CapB family tyrosine-protein kinase [Desulfobacteraceae bacterium]|nr:CpsD/CapB family tyrosine-protein kinase [Desulfobacteraceae bacterium]
MAKTFEALTRSENEHRAPSASSLAQTSERETIITSRHVLDLGSDAARSYQDLRTDILTRYKDDSIKTILFTGTAHGDGASTTAFNFSVVLARESGLKVLLGDLNPGTEDQHITFESDSDRIEEAVNDLPGPDGSRINEKWIGPGNLHSLVYRGNHPNVINLIESGVLEEFLKTTSKRFDYIILAAPPVLGSLEARAICAKVDGVVLVIASGKTRRQIARKCKETLEEAGGRVLGVVLNRRRHYIPQWIYRRL